MRHQTVNSYVAKLVQPAGKLADLIETHAEPSHAGVDLYVRVGDYARFRCRLIECFEHVAAINNRSQLMLNTRRRLTGPKTRETKQRLPDSRLAQLNRFFGKCDAKPVSALSR